MAHENTRVYTKDTIIYPAIEFGGSTLDGQAGAGTNTLFNKQLVFGMLQNATITAQAGNFRANEQLIQQSTTGAGKGKIIYAVVATGFGVITGLLDGQEGTGYIASEEITFRGVENTGSTMTLKLEVGTGNQANINVAGTGYTIADKLTTTAITGSGTGATVKLSAVSGGGGLQIGTTMLLERGTGYEVGDSLQVNGGNNDARISFNIVGNNELQVAKVSGHIPEDTVAGESPMNPQSNIVLDFNTSQEILNFPQSVYVDTGQIQETSNVASFNNTVNKRILIQTDDFSINSRDGVGNTDNHIATIPYEADMSQEEQTGQHHYEPYTMIYQSLDNSEAINLNSLSLRLTDFSGALIEDLIHPTELTLHIAPDYR